MRYFYILFLISMFLPFQGNTGGTADFETPHYSYIHYSVDDGLPQSIISGLMQDSYGFVWISTNEGMAKFDGKHFKIYNEETGYPFRFVTGIEEYKPGQFWVATLVNGLWSLKNEQAKQIPFDSTLKKFQINFLKKTRDGEILLGAEPGGLYVFRNDSLALHIPDKDGGFTGQIISADKDYSGRYWIGTFRNGVQVFDGKQKVLELTEEDGLPSNEIRAILSRPSGKVWIGTPHGLYVYGQPDFAEKWNKVFGDAFVSSIYSKKKNEIWITLASSPGGIVHIKNGKIAEVIKGGKSLFPKCTLIDRYGTLFVGTYRGLMVFPNRNFNNYGYESGLTDTYIRAIAEDPKGTLLVATKNDGLFFLKNNKFKKFKKLENTFTGNSIFAITTINGEIWFGAARGLFILKNGRLIHNKITEYFSGKTVRRIKEIDGKIYIVTKNNLYLYENSQLKNIDFDLRQKKRLLSMWGIGKDKNDHLILATNGNGLWKLKDTTWVSISTPDSVKKFFTLRKGQDGNLYFGTCHGAYKWDGDSLTPVLALKQTVWDVIPTKQNGIWLLTSEGLYHLFMGKIYIYNKKNGLITNEFNMGAIYRKNDDDLWFGGVDGLVRFHKKVKYPLLNPELYITGIKSKKKSYVFPFKNNISFKYSDNNLRIYFNQINFGNKPYYRFAYWLEGFNKDTIVINDENVNFIRYINLPNGKYVFHLYLINPFTHKIAVQRSVAFVVLKPWWKTIPFLFLFTLLFVSLIGLFIRWRESYLKRRNLLLEKQVEERTQDIKLSYKLLKQETEERKKAEISLKKEREQLAITLKSIADGVIRTDLEGKILFMNDAAERITGYGQDKARNKRLKDILKLKEEETNQSVILPEYILNYDNSGAKPTYFNAIFKNPSSGKDKIVNISWSKIKDEGGKESGYVWVLRDISTERKLENEMLRTQKLESIGLLAGGIAHDFNNILSGILGNAQLAQMALDKNADIRKYLKGIEEATQNATHLTQQLLTFAKGGEPVKEIIDIRGILRDSVEFALRGSNVSSFYQIDENLWPIEADKGQLNQVINNLVINAIQAMPGGGSLKITAKNFTKLGTEKDLQSLTAQNFITISIEDSGHGIAKENLNKIFDPYFTTKQRGSGLGLATTYAIIRKHGGHISVSSELGKGTTFTIYLPAVPEEKIKKIEKKEKIGSWQGKRALVMDDEDYIQELMGSFLDLLGIQTEFADNGEEAIEKYREALQENRPYDLVIMDLTIRGGMGGKEAVVRILKLNPKAKVIVASGYSNDSVLANYKEYGFSGRISKPFSLAELSQVLNEVFKEEN